MAPFFIPADTFKQKAIEQLEVMTGRHIAVNGAVNLTFFPNIGLSLEGLEIGNPEGFKEPVMARVAKAELSLALIPLLNRQVVVHAFTLDTPSILLAKDIENKPNWVFTPKDKSGKKPENEREAADIRQRALDEISVPKLTITNGTVRYQETPEQTQEFSKLAVSASLPSIATPFHFSVSGQWNKQDFSVSGNINSARSFLDGKSTTIEATLSAFSSVRSEVKFSYREPEQGKWMLEDGQISVSISSLKDLGKALKQDFLPKKAPATGHVELVSAFSANTESASFTKLGLRFDELSFAGDASIRWKGEKPKILLNAKAEQAWDLNSFIPLDEDMKEGLKQKEPAVTPPAQLWSDAPLPFDLLDAANADIKLELAGVRVGTFHMENLTFNAILKDKVLDIDMPHTKLYGGTMIAKATIDGKPTPPVITKRVKIENVNAKEFLTEAYGFTRLRGTANADIQVRGRGNSQAEIIQTLLGSGMIQVRDGAIEGFNLRRMVQNLKQPMALLADGAQRSDETTDFSELSGTFTLAEGIATNKDLKLLAPLLTVTGEGTVNLPAKTLSYRLVPKLKSTLEGQGRDETATGAGIETLPVKIEGPFDNLKIRPDATALLEKAIQDPKGTVEGIKNDFKGLKDGLKGMLQGL